MNRRLLLVGGLAAAASANALGGAFLYDDVAQIVPNPWLSRLSYAPKLLSTGVWEFSGMATNHFRPAQMLSYLVDSVLFGKTPLPFHAHNLLYHVLASVVVALVVSRWMRSEDGGFAAGLIFAVHPVHAEAVAWIAGMPDVGCGLFYALALLFLLRAQDASSDAAESAGAGGPVEPRAVSAEAPRAAVAWRAAGALVFLAALAFKEMAASLLLVWPIVAVSRGGAARTRARALVDDLALLAGTIAAYLVWRAASLGGLSAAAPAAALSHGATIANAIWLPVRYAMLAAFPAQLSFAPRYEPIVSWGDPRLAIAAVVYAAGANLAVRLWRAGQRPAAAALAAFPLALIPVLDINLTGWTLIAERYLYVPSILVAALGGAAYATFRGRAGAQHGGARAGVLTNVALGALVLAGASRTIAHNSDFRDDVRLWESTAGQRPDSPRVLFNLAYAYETAGRLPDAVAAYRRVIERDPHHAFATANIVRLALQLRVITADEAAARYADMVSGPNPAPELLYLYGDVLLLAGRAAEAIAPLERARAGNPSHLETAIDLATALDLAGRPRESLALIDRALSIHADAPGLLARLAIVSAEEGRWDGADAALARLRAAGGDDARARAAVDSIRAARKPGDAPPSGRSP